MNRTTQTTGAPETAPWPDDKPYKQSPSGMSPARYRAALMRYLAGELLVDIAAEFGCSVSSLYRHARIMRLRKRDVGAPTRRKGPVPVTTQALDGGGVALICGPMGFRLDRREPEKAVDVLFEQIDALCGVDNLPAASVRLRFIEQVRRVVMGWRGGRPPVPATDAAEEAEVDAPGPPLVLRPSQQPRPPLSPSSSGLTRGSEVRTGCASGTAPWA